MKTLKASALCVLFSLSFSLSFAQITFSVKEHEANKPKIFSDLPQRIACNIHMFEVLLDREMGSKINLLIAPGFNFQGTVVSKSDASDARVSTIVIRCTNRGGATLTFTRITSNDGSFSYNGRIISLRHSDAFEFLQENGHFFLVKKEFDDLLME